MLVQNINNTTTYIYTTNASSDYMSIAAELKLGNGKSLNSYVTALPYSFKNGSGETVSCIKLNGYSDMTYYIMNDTVDLHVKQVDCFDNAFFDTLLKAFNFFPNATLTLCGMTFEGPFSFANNAAHNTIKDKNGRCIMLSSTQVRDVEAINTMLSRLSHDNGNIYQPLIRRYLNMLSVQKDKGMLPIGYFNMESYLRVIKSRGKEYFSSLTHPKTRPTVLLKGDGSKGFIKVTGVNKNRVNIELSDNIKSFNMNAINAYNPFVIISLKPFKIAKTRFPWQFVKQYNTRVGLCPILCPESRLKTLAHSINLLEV